VTHDTYSSPPSSGSGSGGGTLLACTHRAPHISDGRGEAWVNLHQWEMPIARLAVCRADSPQQLPVQLPCHLSERCKPKQQSVPSAPALPQPLLRLLRQPPPRLLQQQRPLRPLRQQPLQQQPLPLLPRPQAPATQNTNSGKGKFVRREISQIIRGGRWAMAVGAQ
jgi:hypothetical protein